MCGFLLGLVSVAMWSTVFVIGRLLVVNYSLAPVHFAWVRYAVAAPILFGVLLARGCLRPLLEDVRRPGALAEYAVMGATGCFGMSYFQVLALPHTQATTITMLMATAPLFTLIVAIPLGERITVFKTASLVLGFAGAALIAHAMKDKGRFILPGPFPYYGEMMALLSGACWGIYTALGKRPTARVGGLPATAIAVLFGNLFFVLAAPAIIDGGWPAWQAMVGLGFVGVGGTAVGYVTWYAALRHVEAGKLAILQFLTPVLAYIQAWLILDEHISWLAAAGFMLVAAGVSLVFVKRNHVPAAGGQAQA